MRLSAVGFGSGLFSGSDSFSPVSDIVTMARQPGNREHKRTELFELKAAHAQ
jgi:hypothetical protein